MEPLPKSGLFDFLDMAANKGLMNGNTAAGLKAASNKLLEDLKPEDDVRVVDLNDAMIRYNNRHPNELSPSSLGAYQKRVAQAVAQFAAYKASPTTYKGISRAIQTNGKVETRRRDAPKPADAPKPDDHGGHAAAKTTDSSLRLPYPLRPGFLAEVLIPRDLKKEEADRLSAFIQALVAS